MQAHLFFYKNGSSQGTAYTGLTNGPYFPAVGNAGGTTNVIANFGQRAFAYTAPTNYQPLVDTLLTAPLVAKPNTLMDVALWTANGSSQSITGLGFQPDLVWAKSRNTGATPHLLVDSVRGVNQVLSSHSTDSEQDYSTIGGCISAFNSDGFATGGNSDIATNNRTFVGWAWDAGEGSAVSNPDGSITSQVRANASAGFSIVTYTGNGTGGATFGHGLGVAPEMLIFKTRGVADDWRVYHKQLDASAPANYYLILQSTNAKSGNQGTSFMNSTAPSSTLVTLGTDSAINGTGRTMVCYAFAPVVGYSSFGSYVGNGSSDGPMVWTGFRPRWVLIKDTSNGTNRHWIIIDSTRSFSNESASESVLFADNASSESPANDDFGQFASKNALDLLSNGFKVRESNTAAYTQANLSSNTYIYAAFAERPFQYSRAR